MLVAYAVQLDDQIVSPHEILTADRFVAVPCVEWIAHRLIAVDGR